MSAADVLMAGEPEPTPAETLGALLQLPSVGLSVTRAVVHGHGSRASADLFLSDGTVVQFETLRDIANPSKLAVEITATTGALPRLKAPDAQLVLKLVREIAEHRAVLDVDDISRDMGVTFLQAAQVLDVDMNDQAQRWGGFCYLADLEPVHNSRIEGKSVAALCVVLRDPSGNVYVRTGWFYAHARAMDLGVSQAEIAHRMERVGWQRRGQRGAIKATAPDRDTELSWNFYRIPAGWNQTPDTPAQVVGLSRVGTYNARAEDDSPSRVEATTRDNLPEAVA